MTEKICPSCGEELYSCKNCRWYTKLDGFEDYCEKFKKITYHIRERVFTNQRCPVWELPEDVNYCKTCGRYLR